MDRCRSAPPEAARYGHVIPGMVRDAAATVADLILTNTQKGPGTVVPDPSANKAAKAKASRHQLPDGTPAHSFRTLLDHLGTLARNTIDLAASTGATIQQLTQPTPTQRRAFDLIGVSLPLTLT